LIDAVIVSFLGGLIQAAVGNVRGDAPEADGCSAKTASSVMARCSVSATAVPLRTAAGAIKPIPLWRWSWLYQLKIRRQ
jgi:hypothetical protein